MALNTPQDYPIDYNYIWSYGSTTIQVDPHGLWPIHKQVDNYLAALVSQLDELATAWKNMYVPWQGPDATTAQAFIDELTNNFIELFGPPSATTLADLGPGQGAALKLSAGLSMTAQNYGEAEESVRKLMSDFTDALQHPGANLTNSRPGTPGTHFTTTQVEGPLTEVTNITIQD